MAVNVATIVATLNPAQALVGMRALTAKMGGVKNAAIALGAAFTAAAGIAAVSFAVSAVKSFAEAGDAIQKMALRTGFATETLSEFAHAAELSGASLAAVETAVKRMQRTVLDAEMGLTTAIDAFDLLGVTLEDVQGKTPEEQFEVLSMALADVEDASKRAAVAQMIFGRAGTQLLPMLAAGREGIAAMRQEARELGLVFSQEAADDAAQFNDELTRLQGAFRGLQFAAASELVPALIPVIQWMIKFPVAIDYIVNAFEKVKPFIDAFVTGIGIVRDAIRGLWNYFQESSTGIKILIGTFAAALLIVFAPTSAVILGIIGFIALIGVIKNKWRDMANGVIGVTEGLINGILGLFQSYVENFHLRIVNGTINMINTLIKRVSPLLKLLNIELAEIGEVVLPDLQIKIPRLNAVAETAKGTMEGLGTATHDATAEAGLLGIAAEELANTMVAASQAMAEETDELHPRIEKMRESIKAWTGHMDDLDLAMIEAYEATTDLGHGGNILADTLNKASKAEEERAAAVKKATEDALEEATAAEEERTDAIKKATEMNIAAAEKMMMQGNRALAMAGGTNAYFDSMGNLKMLETPEVAAPEPIDPAKFNMMSFGSIGAANEFGTGQSFDRLVKGKITAKDIMDYQDRKGLTGDDRIIKVSIDGTGFIISDEEKMGQAVAAAINKAAVLQGAIITNEATGAVV